MAMHYAVEFPSEDAKSKGPHIVPENKVKVKTVKHMSFGLSLTRMVT